MDTLQNLTRQLSRWFNGFALVALVAMQIVVAADIVGAKVFSMPVPGAMDLTSLLALLLIGFSMTQTFISGRHIKVDFVLLLLPQRLRRILRILSLFLCWILFLVIVWRLFLYAHDLQTYGETSLTVHIPLCLFAYALAVAFVPMLLAIPVQLYRSWKGLDE